MAATPSTMMPLGTIAPSFELPDTVSGETMSLSELKGEKATLVMFLCNHCPYVLHVNDELVRIANEYQPKGISFIAISSNDVVNYPQDSPELMKIHAKKVGYPFPYLYDETQEVAKAYDAACTPDLFLFDQDLRCVYRGQLDDSRPNNNLPVTGKDMRIALDVLLSGEKISEQQIPSIGCNIKWKI
ncbi:MAG: thioredoxin family protein [Cyclobacteriaceae bacterium]|nr:thioredoxin family protein [Cyclobacteriaceae bacterium]MCK5209160.1 thioredoxin family protein [Cyclobacteriaceae bacterium]MCK5468787.1 thioredoxin family protein [Cyclobacteriaceae bacterium]MCK5699569.1 thioredoxin family protein [Cyclobacteriaceae bacterium]